MSKGAFGDCLKREREMREVSLEEICAATRISTRFLHAMENEDWQKLPGGIFNRGFVRAVSRYLGLDEEDMLAEYDLAHSQDSPMVPTPPPRPIPRAFPGWFALLFLFLLAAVVAGSIYGWRRFSSLRLAISAPSASSAPIRPDPIVVASAPIRPASQTNAAQTSGSGSQTPAYSTDSSGPPSALDLSVAIGRTTQVRVIADGNALYNGLLSAGETRHFQAHSQFDVSVGDSGGVLLELNGETMPPLGTPGSPGKISLTRKDLKRAPGGTD